MAVGLDLFIIQRLLDVTSIEAGQLRLVRGPVDVGALVSETAGRSLTALLRWESRFTFPRIVKPPSPESTRREWQSSFPT
jgi:hypothetical protein